MGNGNKNIIYVEANVMNIYAKFQLHPTYGSEKKIFLNFFKKFSLSAAMATNQNQQFGQNSYGWQRNFCNTFFKISAVT